MRDASFAVIREIGVETGGSNIQFAVNPDNGRMVIIEMNPRVSRSSALASKATGFPIAKIAAKLAVGYLLDEIRLHGENAELKDEATELARKFGIVTPYTAYLIIEDETKRNVPELVQTLPQLNRDRTARREVGQAWQLFQQEKTGDGAVAGARYGLALKSANQTSEALVLSNQEGERALLAMPAISGPHTSANNLGSGQRETPAPLRLMMQFTEPSQQSRFVGGVSFYQNGNQWIDAAVQKSTEAMRQRIQFNSQEYFDLAAKVPQVRPWLALGRNVQFVWNKTVYETYE